MPQQFPDFSHELRVQGPVCGIDEAGRGPLAGPVVAAAVILTLDAVPVGLNDSKVLSNTNRERLFREIAAKSHVGIGICEPEEIDRLNILGATMNAMRRAVLALRVSPRYALIDGNRLPDLPCPGACLVKGDTRSVSIAAASIVAKVTRDRLMVAADARYPGYGFARHKGYPTKAHRDALKTIGVSPIHRRSFAPVRDASPRT